MDINLLKADSNRYQNLVLEREEDWHRLLGWFSGEPIGDAWWPVAVGVFRGDDLNRDLPTGDFPSLGGIIPVFSRRAVDALPDLLEPNGEVLPLACREGEYFAYNVTSVVDALDLEGSECKRVTDTLIIDIPHHEFKSELLTGVPIFKLPQMRKGGRLYVTDEFVRRVGEAGLVGFLFEKVWPHVG